MMSQTKKLSIAFYWHMHQPVYKLTPQGDYLMPWVRMHAVKDYLDMVLWVEKFDNLKLNINLVPSLLDALINYSKDAHDIHSRLTITPEDKLTHEDKIFILNNFFDANYQNMILPNEQYHKLYKIVQEGGTGDTEVLTNQQYSDLMALFNLVWIDPSFRASDAKLKKLYKKGKNYTLEDRIDIINIQRKIIKKIIPTLKKFSNEKKIELTTSPYYHPILPILLDYKKLRSNSSPEDELIDLDTDLDAYSQTKSALNRMEELFGKRPRGMWSSELCVSESTLNLYKDLGVEWSVSDEGILANSINFEFVHDFKGYLEDPYYLLKTYEFNNGVKMIFRDATIQSLISYEYSHHDAVATANDLYDRIKVIQSKILSSPDSDHLLTIALDGENCWENYMDDGNVFLSSLYKLICKDSSLETVLISDYLESTKEHKKLNKIVSEASFNRNLKLWINEPVKDLAWTYLKRVRDDFEKLEKDNPNNPNVELARKELFVCEGSDWFWWYGEPNYSGRDNIFDFIFRTHLKNVYNYFDVDYPEFLDDPLTSISASQPSNYPICGISPEINGKDVVDNLDVWNKAGCIEIPDGPVLRESKLFEKIRFGCDSKNLYFKFHLNKYIKTTSSPIQRTYQIYIYLRKAGRTQALSPIRLINKSENISPMSMEKFHNEIQVSIREDELRFLRIIKAIPGDMWVLENHKHLDYAYDEVLDLKIPFDILEVEEDETIEFLFINANLGMIDFYIPNEMILSVTRPVGVLNK